jgi:hypothetical protein
MAEVTWDEFFKNPEILSGIVSEVVQPDHYFSAWLGLRLDSQPERVIYDGRVNWDVQDMPRTVAVGRQTQDGFATKTPKEVEAKYATIARFAQKTEFYDNDFLKMRPLGVPWEGVVTSDMRSWITREMQAHRAEFDAAWEFMLVRLLQGGFGFSLDNNTKDWMLCEKDAGDYNVDPGIPAGNLGQLDLYGAGGSDIIAAAWDLPATSIVSQMQNLDVACSVLGIPVIREIHVPAEALIWFLNNTEFKAIAGSSNRPYDTLEETIIVDGPTGQRKIVRQFYRFPALPHHKFFVNYDNVLLGYKDRQSRTVETTASNLTRLIPATKAMFLPEREQLKKFITKMDGAEYVATDMIGGKALMDGHSVFQHKLVGEKPGWVGKEILHSLPIVKVPRWLMFPTVDF